MSLENVQHIVLVLSGKGGVGKSSITTQLALSLCLAGHRVGILDIDLTGPSIPRLLGIESAKVTQAPGGWLPVEVHAGQVLPPVPSASAAGLASRETTAVAQQTSASPAVEADGAHDSAHPACTNGSSGQRIGALHCMSLAFLLSSRDTAVVWRGPKKTAMVRQFLTSVLWPPLAYLLIDTPPGTSDEHISLAETLLQSAKVAGAVVVTTPQAVAISDVRKEINFCAKVGVGVLGVVENMSGYVCECCGVGTNLFGRGGGEVMSREVGVRFLGRVALDAQWGRLVEEGRRPRYGGVEVRQGEGEVDGKGEERDEGLLVDKYRSCSLCATFEGITRQVIDVVEGGSGVGR